MGCRSGALTNIPKSPLRARQVVLASGRCLALKVVMLIREKHRWFRETAVKRLRQRAGEAARFPPLGGCGR